MTNPLSSQLVSRSWNGTPISRRTTDGYVNATAMCKANGKRWTDYRESDRCQQYLDALESKTGISGFDLIQSRRGGTDPGTWVHPQVAVDLARWISAPFAVWMDGWFLEGLQPTPAEPAPINRLDPVEATERTIAVIRNLADFFQEMGGMDERDQILFKDIARNQLLKLTGGAVPVLPGDEEMTLSDAWLEVYGKPLPRSNYRPLGMLVANAYREEFNEEPPTRLQYVDNAPRQVKSYRRNWLITTLQRFKDQLTGSQS